MQSDYPLHTEARPSAWKKWILFLVLVGGLAGFDQVTKRAVHNNFKLYESRPVIESFLNLTYVRNSGAAFGLLSRQKPAFLRVFFLSVTSLALIILVIYYARVPWNQMLTLWGLCLIASGALGNGIDRLLMGQVIDFIDVHVNDYHWPAFNVADSAICVGVGFLLIDTFRFPASE